MLVVHRAPRTAPEVHTLAPGVQAMDVESFAGELGGAKRTPANIKR
jgi:hypothetical protein